MQWHTSNGTLQRRRVLGEPTSWVGSVGLAVAVAVAYALAIITMTGAETAALDRPSFRGRVRRERSLGVPNRCRFES